MVACSDDDGNPCLYNPTLTTSTVTNITETAATLNGVISIVSQNCDDPSFWMDICDNIPTDSSEFVNLQLNPVRFYTLIMSIHATLATICVHDNNRLPARAHNHNPFN